jgi:hypothetical protein
MSLLDGLVAYWKFDEGSGTTAADATGGGLDLTASGSSWDSSGLINAGAAIGSSSNYGGAVFSSDAVSYAPPYTLNFWIKEKETGQKNFSGAFSSGGNSSSNFQLMSDGSGNLTYQGAATIAFGPESTSWIMLTLAVDESGNVQTYYSGVAANSGTDSYTTINNFYVGRNRGLNFYLYATFDEMGFWSRVLSADEISDLYNGGSGLSHGDFGGGASMHPRSFGLIVG